MRHKILNSAIIIGVATMIAGCSTVDLSTDGTSFSKYSPSNLFKQTNAAPVYDLTPNNSNHATTTMNIQVEFKDKFTQEKQTFTYLLPNNRLQKTQQQARIGNEEILFNLSVAPCTTTQCTNGTFAVSLDTSWNKNIQTQGIKTSKLEATKLAPVTLAPIDLNKKSPTVITKNDPLTPELPKVVKQPIPVEEGQANLNIMPGATQIKVEMAEDYILDPKTGKFVSESSPEGQKLTMTSTQQSISPLVVKNIMDKSINNSETSVKEFTQPEPIKPIQSFKLDLGEDKSNSINDGTSIHQRATRNVQKNIVENSGRPYVFIDGPDQSFVVNIRLVPLAH